VKSFEVRSGTIERWKAMNVKIKKLKEIGMIGKKARLLVTFLLFVAATPVTVWAQEETWEYMVAPYMWLLSLDGEVTVKGQETDVDSDFGDVWDELNIAAMMNFKARKGRWGFYGEIIYANLGKTTHAAGIRIDPDIDVLWLTAGGFYRLGPWDLSEASEKGAPTVTTEVFAGANYTNLDMKLDIEGFRDPEGDQDLKVIRTG
jgi:hypothetical protein